MAVWILSSIMVLCVSIWSCMHISATASIDCPNSYNLTVLDCRDRALIAFPDINDKKAVTYLDMSLNKIGKLSQEKWPTLVYLNLSQNSLTAIEQMAFAYMNHLVTLDLSYNLLSGKNFTTTTFEYLKKLEVLILRGNPIRYLGERVIDSFVLTALRYLDLSYSMISLIDKEAIDLNKLQQLSLRGNLLSDVDLRVFSGMGLSLLELDISENPTIKINKLFYPLQRLQNLTMESCQLLEIGDTAFTGLDSLLYLSLGNNSLTALSKGALRILDKLEELVLNKNPFKVIDMSTFGELDSLWPIKRLRLDSMPELSSIKEGAFVNFDSLVEISIQNNSRLKTIEGSAFSGEYPKIRVVHLDNNGLSGLPENLLPWEDLKTITLTGNRWYCDCSWKWVLKGNLLLNKSTPIICNGPLEHEGLNLLELSPEDLGCVSRTTKIVLLFFLVIGVIALIGFSVYFAVMFRRKSRYSMKDLLCLACWRRKDGRYISVYQNDDTEPFTTITCFEEEDTTKTAVNV